MVIDIVWSDPNDAEHLFCYEKIVDSLTSGKAYVIDLETYIQCLLLPTKQSAKKSDIGKKLERKGFRPQRVSPGLFAFLMFLPVVLKIPK